jgi:Ser/Thr protein kinase RdoA (MazF antagonist)
VIEAFDLEVARDRNVQHNRRSRNLIIDTTQGRVILKKYRPEWGVGTVECVHSILTALEDLDEPAPRLKRTPQAADSVVGPDGVFAVFEFVKGASFASTYLLREHRLRITAAAAKAMARIHSSLVDFTPAGEHHHGVDSEGRPKRDLEWHIQMVDQLKRRTEEIEDQVERELANRLSRDSGRLLETLALLDAEVGRADLPTTVIHGDFGIHNLIFPRNESPVPIDFELSRRDWRLNDLISATGKHRFKDGGYDVESMRVFINAYDEENQLLASERELMAEAWAHYKLRAAVQYWNSYHSTGGPARKLRSALDSISQADQVIENPEPIRLLVRTERVR